MPHRGGARETNMSEVHLDFLFLGREEDSPQTMAVLVAKKRTSQMITSAAAPGKTTGTCFARRVVGFLREIWVSSRRYGREERPVEDVARVNGTDGGRYVVKYSPVGARLSHGMVERAMQSVSGQTRVLLSTMVWGRSIPYDHPWMCRIVGYAGVLKRFEVGWTQRQLLALASARRCCGGGRRLEDHFGKLTSLWEGLWEVDVAVGGMTHIWEVVG